ncbi:MAG: SAF domain-containing protein [Acidimicrobiales bacterium]
MTTLLDRPNGHRPFGRTNGIDTVGFRLPVNPRRRRPVLAALSAVAVFASVGLFAHLYSSANHQTPVLVVTHTIQEGQELTATDLGQTPVATGSGVVTIPVGDAPEVLGKVASVTVMSGSLLTPGDVSSVPPITAGYAVVGLALKQGQLPAAGLGPGDEVMVIETGAPGSPLGSFIGPSSPSSSADGSSPVTGSPDEGASAEGASSSGSSSDGGGDASGVLVPDALVFNTASPGAQSSDDATELVSLELADSVAPAVSTAAAAGQVSLVLVPSTAPIGSSSPLAGIHPAGTAPPGRTGASSKAPSPRRRPSPPTHSPGSAPDGGSG